jgi:hypothetical protein
MRIAASFVLMTLRLLGRTSAIQRKVQASCAKELHSKSTARCGVEYADSSHGMEAFVSASFAMTDNFSMVYIITWVERQVAHYTIRVMNKSSPRHHTTVLSLMCTFTMIRLAMEKQGQRAGGCFPRLRRI